MKQQNNTEFLLRLRSRDKAAMALIIDQYAPVLLLLILLFIEDRDKAEKILQNSFLIAFTHIESFNPEKESTFIWLLKCVIPLIDVPPDEIIDKFLLITKHLG